MLVEDGVATWLFTAVYDGQQTWNLQDIELAAAAGDDQLLAISEALDKLAAQDKPKAELVKLRYFIGMTIEEAAELPRISEPTAKSWWTYSRAWLFAEIGQDRR